eukprot:2502713-Amphidinium_carterae.1
MEVFRSFEEWGTTCSAPRWTCQKMLTFCADLLQTIHEAVRMEVAGIKVAEIGSEVKVVGVHKLLGVYQQGTPDGKHQTSWAARLCQPHRWRQVLWIGPHPLSEYLPQM